MFCNTCGAPNPDGAAFCGRCGSSLGAPKAPAAPASPPPIPMPPPPPGAAPGPWQTPYPAAYPPPYAAAPVAAATGSLAVRIVGFVFAFLGIIAAVIAFFLSEEGAYGWSAGIWLLAAILFAISGLSLYMGRTRPMAPYR